jgi:hypothetical protein
VRGLTLEGDVARFTTAEPTRSLSALMALLSERGVEVVALSVKAGTLEDVFLQRTGAEPDR